MSMIRGIQARGPARKLVSDGALTESEIAGLQKQLIAFGFAAIKPLLDSVPAGPVHPHAQVVLERLLTNESLPTYVEALRSPRPSTVDAAAAALSSGQGYDPAKLLPLLSEPAYSRGRLERILAAQVQAIAPRVLLEALTEAPRETRGVVVRLLDQRVDPSIANDLARLAIHEDPWYRQQALRLLSRLDVPVAADTAVRLLGDPHAPVRLEAVSCLTAHRAVGAIPALCGRLRDDNLKVQAAAIQTLIAIDDVSAVTALLEYLKDDSEYVRRAAVEVLNRVVTVEAVKDLVDALRDADWWVRVRAADALGTLGGDRVVEAVMGLLDDEDGFIRRYAVEILNMVPDARAVAPLIRALDDEDWWVRERTIDALAKTADPRAVEPLIAMLDRDPQAVPIVLRALGAIGDPRALEALCRHVSIETPEVKAAAVEALKTFAKSELTDEARAAVHRALKEAGLVSRAAPPLEMRRSADPEFGRSHPAHPPTAAPAAPGPAPTPPLDTAHLAPGTKLSERYRILRHVGGGGFGTVYLAEDTLVSEQVALKLLAPHLCQDELMIQRFVEELKLTRRITHRNVIRIHEFLDFGGVRAISMEFVTGRDLGQIIADQKRLGVAQALDIAEQALQGLAAAHELGIVHRDIKPGNLLMGLDGTVKIVDFGLAAVTQSSRARLTLAGTLIGTPEYIAPEQIKGGKVDGRADLYSLGCVLYIALSGREPFSGESAVKTLFQHLEGDVPALARLCEDVPEEVSDLVACAMAREPDERPATAADMIEAIRRLRRAA